MGTQAGQHDNGNTADVTMLLAAYPMIPGLLDAGADPPDIESVQNNDGHRRAYTLLHHMAEEGITEYVRHEDVEALLNAGADPNLIDEKAKLDAGDDNVHMVQMLLDETDISARSVRLRTL